MRGQQPRVNSAERAATRDKITPNDADGPMETPRRIADVAEHGAFTQAQVRFLASHSRAETASQDANLPSKRRTDDFSWLNSFQLVLLRSLTERRPDSTSNRLKNSTVWPGLFRLPLICSAKQGKNKGCDRWQLCYFAHPFCAEPDHSAGAKKGQTAANLACIRVDAGGQNNT